MPKSEIKPFEVGEVLRLPSHEGRFRVWRVVGVNLGATNQENTVTLETLDMNPADGNMYCTVPERILEEVFRYQVNNGRPNQSFATTVEVRQSSLPHTLRA